MEALELDVRRRIYYMIQESPGLHFRELQRTLDMPIGQLEHHLRFLEKQDMVKAKEDRYYLRYFPSKMDTRETRILASLRQEKPRRIVVYLLEHPRTSHKELVEHLDVRPSTMSFYLKDLVEKGVLGKEKQGRENLYWIEDEKRVIELLLSYRRSFLDKLVDRFLEVWLES